MSNFSISDFNNLSNAYNSRYLLMLENKPRTLFWIKDITIPSITIDPITVEHSSYDFKREGSKIKYGDLSMSLYIDENFLVYRELYDWMILSIPGQDYKDPKTVASIIIFDNSFNKIVATFTFYDFFISSIPSIEYDNHTSSHITISPAVNYSNFKVSFS